MPIFIHQVVGSPLLSRRWMIVVAVFAVDLRLGAICHPVPFVLGRPWRPMRCQHTKLLRPNQSWHERFSSLFQGIFKPFSQTTDPPYRQNQQRDRHGDGEIWSRLIFVHVFPFELLLIVPPAMLIPSITNSLSTLSTRWSSSICPFFVRVTKSLYHDSSLCKYESILCDLFIDLLCCLVSQLIMYS